MKLCVLKRFVCFSQKYTFTLQGLRKFRLSQKGSSNIKEFEDYLINDLKEMWMPLRDVVVLIYRIIGNWNFVR
jgi:hypothetical protein